MYAEILLNQPYSRINPIFTYLIPKNLQVKIGQSVLVPFKNKSEAGLVLKITKEVPNFKSKEILEILSEEPLLETWQMELADWISEQYFCSIFDAYKLMLPKHIWRNKKSREIKSKYKNNEINKERHSLKTDQKEILDTILKEKPKVSLLHGITGAGKTEVYRHLIEEMIKTGKQVLLLVPEIALTPQLLGYFQGHFDKISILHSKVSDGQKSALWKDIKSGESKLIIGSRSAIFYPFQDLGLIIMDEEHEWSYKQDSSPRYHTREVAKKIGELTGSLLLMGSATPSIESMYEAQIGKIKLFTLKERISGTDLPKVEIVDLREELRAGNYSVLSSKLEQKIRTTLEQKEQIILFLNRRGSASATVCRDCGEAIKCKSCEVNMTYHSKNFLRNTLLCHHCGRMEEMPETCENCGSPKIKHFGIGTEKVEEELRKLFPLAKIARADKDTMSAVNSYENLHQDLQSGEIDILIGTQMIGKGFDIAKVSLVGVILADLGIHIPDFRSSERNFQLLTQVAGRSGRREKQGEVIIQSYLPENKVIQLAKEHDYMGFYEQEIGSRKEMDYPPFSQIIKLLFSNESKDLCEKSSESLKAELERINDGEHKIYSAPALITKINGKYHWHVFVQGKNPKQILKKLNQDFLKNWRIDVDPMQCI